MVRAQWSADAEVEDVFFSANSSEKSSEVQSSENNPPPPESTSSPARIPVEPRDGQRAAEREKLAPSASKNGIGGEGAAALQPVPRGPARTATGKTPLPTLAPTSQTPPTTSSESASDVGPEAEAAGDDGRPEPEADAEAEREHPATDSGTTTCSSSTSATSSSTSFAGDIKTTPVPTSSGPSIVVEHVCSSPYSNLTTLSEIER